MQSRNKNMRGDKQLYNNMNRDIFKLNVDDDITLPVSLANNSPYLLQGQFNSLDKSIDTESILFGIKDNDKALPKIRQNNYDAPNYGTRELPNIFCPDLTIFQRYRPT
jgi:hypothetical protein